MEKKEIDYSFQDEWVELGHRKRLLAFDTGLGKTIITIKWADKHLKKGDTLLVVSPKSVKQKWIDTIEEFRKGEYQAICLTKEEFRDKFSPLQKVEAIVIDEVHNGFLSAGKASKLFKKAMSYMKSHNIEYRLFLTATPYTCSSINIFRICLLLGNEWDFMKWRQEFQRERYMGSRSFWEDKPGIRDKLKAVTKELGDFMDTSEVYEEPVQRLEVVDLPMLEKKISITGTNHFVHQLMDEQVGKEEYIAPILEKYKRVIIVANYHDQIEAIANYFNITDIISGKHEDREELIKRLQEKDEYRVIISADVNEGYELPDTECIIFASLSFKWSSYKQMLGRVSRINKPSKTDIFLLLREGKSLDRAVYKNISQKKDFHISLYLQS